MGESTSSHGPPESESERFRQEFTHAELNMTLVVQRVSPRDLDFTRQVRPDLSASLDEQHNRITCLAQHVLEQSTMNPAVATPQLAHPESVEENWRDTEDVIDRVIEKAHTIVDEVTGAVKKVAEPVKVAELESAPRAADAPGKQAKSSKPELYRDKDLKKPQEDFEQRASNYPEGSFRPLLRAKPHAQVSLPDSLQMEKLADGKQRYAHPYRAEIRAYDFPASVYKQAEPIPYHPFETTTAHWVDTPERLELMMTELKKAKEIAVDLEHHDKRTFTGLVSLMQISTRDQDWIVDTLQPWRHKLQCLNEVFADPSILKVLHGAYMDIIWLQRDFGVYVVGLFDTFHAAQALGFERASFAFALEKFTGVIAQKKYQLADWRIRPLPQELFDYARSDTHYLLFIFDNMRNELMKRSDLANPEQNLVKYVLDKSKFTALRCHQNFVRDPEFGQGPVGWYNIMQGLPVPLAHEHFAIYRALHAWRDEVARREDESIGWVLQDRVLLALARGAPKTKRHLLIIAHQSSPITYRDAGILVDLIAEAKDKASEIPDFKSIVQRVESADRAVAETSTAPRHSLTVSAASSANVATEVSESRLRATESGLWGKARSELASDPPATVRPPDLSLTVPLPPLTAKVFKDPPEVCTPALESPAVQLDTENNQPEKQEDIFIIRQPGKSRKRKFKDDTKVEQTAAHVDSDPAEAAQVAMDPEEELQADTMDLEEAPGSSNAPTAVTSAPLRGKAGKKKNKKKKAFSPFSNLADGPRGAANPRGESAGKSKTFSK